MHCQRALCPNRIFLLFVGHRLAQFRAQRLAALDGRARAHPVVPGLQMGEFVQRLDIWIADSTQLQQAMSAME